MSGSIGGIDASIPLRAGQGVAPPQNPLAQYAEYANLQGALNRNALFPGQQQLQQQELQRGQLAIEQAQLAQTQQRVNSFNSALAPLIRLGPNVTNNDVMSTVAGLHAAGFPTDEFVRDMTATMPVTDPAKPDPAHGQALQSWVLNHAARVWSPDTQASAFRPGIAQINTGPDIQLTDVNPYSNPNAVGTKIPLGLSPEGASTPTQIGVTPKGEVRTGTRQQFIDKASGGFPDRFPDALRNPARAPEPGVVTSLGPAATAALEQQGSQSAKAFSDIADQGVRATDQRAVLGNMLGDTAQFESGPSKINDFKKNLTRYTPAIARAFGVSPDSVAANESFDKLASQIQSAQGVGSDARLNVAGAANPSSHLTPAGVDQIIRQLQGNSDYLQARAKLAVKYPDQSDRAGFESSIRDNLDPRAFQFERMTGPQKTTYVNSLSADDKKAVRKSYNFAVQNGLIGNGN